MKFRGDYVCKRVLIADNVKETDTVNYDVKVKKTTSTSWYRRISCFQYDVRSDSPRQHQIKEVGVRVVGVSDKRIFEPNI